MLELLLNLDGFALGAGVPGLAKATNIVSSETEPSVRVGIASSIRLVREGLSLALAGRPAIVDVQAFGLDIESLRKMAVASPDVILADLSASSPHQIAQTLKAACPNAKLVAFALTEIDQNVFACAASGFVGYVAKDGGADELHLAVMDVMCGRLRCAPHIAAAMFDRLGALLRPPAPATPALNLTARESEVLRLADEGQSNKEIARRLRISNATVKNHMHSILQKLQVGRRGEATARLRREPVGDPRDA